MFSGVIRLLSFCFLATLAISSPITSIPEKRSLSTALTPVSLNNWGGFSVLSNFDDFFGDSNFDGFNNAQVLLEQELVCGLGTGESISSIDVVQQQLSILSELACQIILTELCEVEVQMLAFQQFFLGLSGFSDSLLRLNGLEPSFDSSIAGLGSSLFTSGGALNTNFGFSGQSIGQNSQLVSSNWNNNTSFQSVSNAMAQAQIASLASNNNSGRGNAFQSVAEANGSSD